MYMYIYIYTYHGQSKRGRGKNTVTYKGNARVTNNIIYYYY